MYKIELVFENGTKGVFKSYYHCDNDKVGSLNPRILRNKEDSRIRKNSASLTYFGCSSVLVTKLDGRTKEAKKLDYFTYRFCFENLK